jgi:CBS domain-containing protein
MNDTTFASIMRPAVAVDEETAIRDALIRMNKEKCNELLVVDAEGLLVGEVSINDLLGAVIPANIESEDGIEDALTALGNEEAFRAALQDAAERSISECVSYAVESVRADARLIDVAATAMAMGQARIPVVDHDGRPVGIISRQGLRHILSEFLDVKE